MTPLLSPKYISLEELANGYCLAMANAFRLVEDGEKLFYAKRYTGAVGLFRIAIDEIIKAHLIQKAVTFGEDKKKWEWFWATFNGWKEKVKVLQEEIHEQIYKSPEAREKYKKAHALLAFDFNHVWFDENSGIFGTPSGNLFSTGNDKELTRTMYEYVMGLFHAFNYGGLPNTETILKTFKTLQTNPVLK